MSIRSLVSALVELLGWTLDRTADLPKSSRFTFGQRLDNLALDALQTAVRAIYSARAKKAAHLEDLNLILEQLRVLWRLCCDRRWISQNQLLFVVGRIDEIGKIIGGWRKQIQASSGR